jgi:hypothetical protein
MAIAHPFLGRHTHLLESGLDAIFIKDFTLRMFTVEGAYTEGELSLFKGGRISYGLFVHDHIPNLILNFSHFPYHYFLNVFELFSNPTDDQIGQLLKKCYFAIFTPKEFTALCIRSFSFCDEFLGRLKQALIDERSTYCNKRSVKARITEQECYLSTTQMLAGNKLYSL